MTTIGAIVSAVLLILKLGAIGTFATLSWPIVAAPLLIALAIDFILFAIFGTGAFFMTRGR